MALKYRNLQTTLRLFQRRHRLAAQSILLEALARTDRDVGSEDFGTFFYGRRELADAANCSETSCKVILNRLETHHIITRESTHKGTRGRFTDLSSYIHFGHQTHPQTACEQPLNSLQTHSKLTPNSPLILKESKEEVEDTTATDLSDIESLRETWNSLDLPHQGDWHNDPTAHAAANQAIGMFGKEAVIGAIQNYAKVLRSSDYFFNHKWRFRHFLQRGLEQFLDDVDPLANFAVESKCGAGADVYVGGLPDDFED